MTLAGCIHASRDVESEHGIVCRSVDKVINDRGLTKSTKDMVQSAVIVAILKFVISLANAFKQETEELVG